MGFINTFFDKYELQSAIAAGRLLTPYVASVYDESGDRDIIDYNSFGKLLPIPTDEIWYKTIDNVPIEMSNTYDAVGAEVVSNTYDSTKGMCVAKFNGDVTKLSCTAEVASPFYNKTTLTELYLPDTVQLLNGRAESNGEYYYHGSIIGCDNLIYIWFGCYELGVGPCGLYRSNNTVPMMPLLYLPTLTSIHPDMFKGPDDDEDTGISSVTLNDIVPFTITSQFPFNGQVYAPDSLYNEYLVHPFFSKVVQNNGLYKLSQIYEYI